MSLLFAIQILILGSDIFSVQLVHSELDALALTVGHSISQSGRLSQELYDYVASYTSTELVCLLNCQPRFGDTVTFIVQRQYDPLILSDQTLLIRVKRSTVVGYYN